MRRSPKQIAILGSTGSIGTNALEVIAASEGRLAAIALSGHSGMDRLRDQAIAAKPRWVVATDERRASRFRFHGLDSSTEVLIGPDALVQVACDPEVDIVLAAIVGTAGLRSTWAALDAGKTVALANKETLVVAGSLITRLAAERDAKILPVDSEHSGVFQCLASGQASEVSRIVLTASGGPFREWSFESLRHVTVEEALAHPTWDMGAKITVDSATMMNKALEIVEARWLFDIDSERISVVIHPQSTVHAFVEFVDGSVLAQMSPPDMKLPIQYALDFPCRHDGPAKRLDFSESMAWEFQPADFDRFPALRLGFDAAEAGGTAGAVLSAANEAAVAAFLDGNLHFTEIVPACRSVLDEHDFDPDPSLDQIMELDGWARKEVASWMYA